MIGDRLRTLIWVNRIRQWEGHGWIFYFPPNVFRLGDGDGGRSKSCPVARMLPGYDVEVRGNRRYEYIPWGLTQRVTGTYPEYVRRYIEKLDIEAHEPDS